MRIARIKSEEPLEKLATRLYSFEGKGSAAEVKAAGKALSDANPFLRKLSDVPEGTLLIVPELEGAAPKKAAEPVEGVLGAILISRLREAAAEAVELLTAELDEEVADAESSQAVLRSTEARRFARNDDGVKLIHDEASEAVKERLAAAGRLRTYRDEVATQVEADLDELLSSLRGMGQA